MPEDVYVNVFGTFIFEMNWLIVIIIYYYMPHGSEKSPEKNRNEIRHSLCMPDERVKIVANYEETDT